MELINCHKHEQLLARLSASLERICDSQLAKRRLDSALDEIIVELEQCSKDKKEDELVIMNLQHEIAKQREEKEALLQRHLSILENIEILLFQKDYEELLKNISLYKQTGLELTFVDSGAEYSLEDVSEISVVCESSRRVHKEEIQRALAVINSEAPFEEKQDVWLKIVYDSNEKSTSELQHVTVEEALDSCRERECDLSELMSIGKSEINEEDKGQKNCSPIGQKKIRSSILLKESFEQRKRHTKTSIKKENNDKENVEQSTERERKKSQYSIKTSKQKGRQESTRPEATQSNIKQKRKATEKVITTKPEPSTAKKSTIRESLLHERRTRHKTILDCI